MFVDRVEVTLQAGDGGDGLMSFRRERFVIHGGPDGGDGGDGGDIIFVASTNQNTLANFRHQKLLKAVSGVSGGKRKRHGRRGDNLCVKVPVGTVISTLEGEQLIDLSEDDQTAIIARGGKGGFGNAHFTSSTRQAPRFAEKGEPGQKYQVLLELKMIADVGLVGLPNAGKSTLLSVISNARPTIADYPFTTLIPNLGVVDVDNKTSLLFADIPGLIEGAHKGKGLGDEFLRHVERTSVLVHLIDIYSQDVITAYKTIMAELAAYQPDLSTRSQIVVLTKTDGFDRAQLAARLKTIAKIVPKNTPVLAISSASRDGVIELLRTTSAVVKKARLRSARKLSKQLPIITLKEDHEAWQITKSKNKYIVTGRKIERFAQKTHFDNEPSQQRIRDILRKMGIARGLEKQGIKPGQIVQIGDPSIGQLEY